MQGQLINGYELKHLLGQGGMAEVWYAENEIGLVAAVKVLNADLSHNEQIVERFHNEALMMVKLNHPNIRRVYGYGYLGDRHCIIMEYLEGEDLEALIKSGRRFTEEELRRWWNQSVDALNYTHAMGIVHRDIKPSNFFLDQSGDIRLLDFGIAKDTGAVSMTRTGTRMGTLMYMSPEQVRNSKDIDYRTDIYSLALTFVQLFAGKHPCADDTTDEFDIQLSIVTKPVDLSGVPAEWQGFLAPYLEKEPGKRPALRHFEAAVSKTVQSDSDDASITMEKTQPIIDSSTTLTGSGSEGSGTSNDNPSTGNRHSGLDPLSPESKEKPKRKKGLWIALTSVGVVIAAVLLWPRNPYRQIDQWMAESEQIYNTYHIEAPMEDYTTAVDALNKGYEKCNMAIQALEELYESPPKDYPEHMMGSAGLESKYLNNITEIVEKELIALSIADSSDKAAGEIIVRLRQLEKSDCYKSDSSGRSLAETIERNIDILCHQDLFIFDKDGKYGYIDKLGNVVISPRYEHGYAFSDGLLLVKMNDKWGYVNKLGQVVVDFQFKGASSFSEGLAYVYKDDSKGYIDKSGTMVIDGQHYEVLSSFHEGLAKVEINGKQGFIDRTGKLVIDAKYARCWYFSEGLASFHDADLYLWGSIDKSGRVVIAPRFHNWYEFHDGIAQVYHNCKDCLIDRSGKIIMQSSGTCAYCEGLCYSEGLIRVKTNGKYKYLDLSGKMVFEAPNYDFINSFHEGLAMVSKNGKYGYIDKSGNLVIDMQYDEAHSFSKGLAKVKFNDKYCYIDKTGKVVFSWNSK